MTLPVLRSVTASPLDITQPLATCVMGTRLRTLTSGVNIHDRDGTAQMPSDWCADSSASRRTVRAVTGSISVTSDAGMVLTETSRTMRLATKARVPSGVTATAYGSRPADGRPNSCNGETESTEMSSDKELATTSRSPAVVRQKATATGDMPTGIVPVS